MSVGVSADIEAICGKCGGETWHVIVAKVGTKIAKVLCKQCGGQHRYRSTQVAPGAVRAHAGASRPGSSTPRATRKARAQQPQVEPDLSRPIRTYRISDSFQVGDRLQHATFGLGVVEQLPGPRKIQVFFPDGRRVLAHEHS